MNFQVIQSEQTPIVPPITCAMDDYTTINHEVLEKFLEFAKQQSNCAGLAANQVSLNGNRLMQRFFAFRYFQSLNSKNDWDIAINPVITTSHGVPVTRHEGCLTWRDTQRNILAKRHIKVTVTFFSAIQNKQITLTAYGFMAQVFQHEINHLNGISEEIYELKDESRMEKETKIERNEPCPCGSGMKHKNCCRLKLIGAGKIEFH